MNLGADPVVVPIRGEGPCWRTRLAEIEHDERTEQSLGSCGIETQTGNALVFDYYRTTDLCVNKGIFCGNYVRIVDGNIFDDGTASGGNCSKANTVIGISKGLRAETLLVCSHRPNGVCASRLVHIQLSFFRT